MEEKYDKLCEELKKVCEDYENDLDDWEIEDALVHVKSKYQ